MNNVVRTFDAVVDSVDTENRSIVARINTSSKDRYNTVIAARGGKFKAWRASGMPVLWEHGKDVRRFTDPIANSKGIWNNGGPNPSELLAEPQFLKDEFSQQRFEWYRDGKIRGWSVNILPVANNAGPPTKEELRSRPDWEGADLIYRDWELAEFSGTVIPGNAEALTADRASAVMELVERSLVWMPDDVRSIYESALTRTTPDVPEPAKEADARGYSIVHEDSFWCIRDAEGVLITADEDEQVIRRAFAAMQVSRTWDDLHTPMAEHQLKRNAEIAKYLTDELDLRLKGTV